MAYYNSPYRNIFRAFLRAIRVFISSLFSKRLLLMIIIALIIMLLHLNVQAVNIDDLEQFDNDGLYKTYYVSEPVYDNESDLYSLDYYTFINSGGYAGNVKIPSNIYDFNNWLLYVNNSGVPKILVSNANATSFYIRPDGNLASQDRYLLTASNYYDKARLIDIYTYDISNENWSLTNSFNNNNRDNFFLTKYEIMPNSILYTKNSNMKYFKYADFSYSSGESYTLLRNVPRIIYPHCLGTSNGLRFYLGYFYNVVYTGNNTQGETILTRTNVLSKINCVIGSVGGYYKTFDLLDFSTVVHDEENDSYYIDLIFEDVFGNDFYTDDYIISFIPQMTSTIHYQSLYGTIASLDYTVLYNRGFYYRFDYSSVSGVGILKDIYENGSDKSGQDNPEEPSQEDNNSQAINELNNTIINQTTIIQQQTNTINDMSNFMQNDNYSTNTITDNMPNSNEYQDITESGFDNIFTTLRNTFTSDNYQDVVFTIPFTNGKTITLPSNLTENIVPETIKTLIQMVYWFIIARFIVKDIAKYIENAKSGDIFSTSDTNIKTDML